MSKEVMIMWGTFCRARSASKLLSEQVDIGVLSSDHQLEFVVGLSETAQFLMRKKHEMMEKRGG